MPRPAQGGASYRAVLALPHARALAVAGALARLPYGLVSLPLLLALRDAAGSYGVAGGSVGLYGLLAAVLGPWRARLVERRPGALRLLAAGYAAALALIAVLAALATHGARGPLPDVAAPGLAVLAGTLPPPVGPLLRARFGTLARDEAQRQAVLSLDAVAEATVFSVGPLLGGLLLAATSPAVAAAVVAGLVVLGFGVFAPVLGRGGGPGAAPAGGTAPAGQAAPGPDGDRGARAPLRSAAFLAALGSVGAVGTAGAMAALAAVAAWGPATAGPLNAAFSAGGVLGGLAYGRRSWRRSPRGRLGALGAAGAAALLLPVLTFAPAGAAPGLLIAGGVTDATLITAYLLTATAEGQAWINTAFNLGVALGSGASGALIAATGPRPIFGLASLLLLVPVPASLPGRGATAVPRASGRARTESPAAPQTEGDLLG